MFLCIILIAILVFVYVMRDSIPIVFQTFWGTIPKFIKSLPDNVITSPAYGKIIKIHETDAGTEIVIFLSPIDIHTQYVPISGMIENTIYDKTGKFELANFADKSRMNEKNITTIKNKFGRFVVKQIAGFFYRRIYTYHKIGSIVSRGQELGSIAFGSRVDLIVPKQTIITVREGDYVNGEHTVIGWI